ncbi:hypothetical protein WOLCODRAFT_167272, partial [Wolfiporia cocos MD-104 SS10]
MVRWFSTLPLHARRRPSPQDAPGRGVDAQQQPTRTPPHRARHPQRAPQPRAAPPRCFVIPHSKHIFATHD